MYIPVGKVAKAHGIKGEIKVYIFPGYQVDFSNIPEIVIAKGESGQNKRFAVVRSRKQTKYYIVELAGITDRNEAEALCGSELYIKKDYLPPAPQGEYYWHEIAGMQVVTDKGRELGSVTDMIDAGPNTILVVTGKGHEYLIPATPEFIIGKDDDTKTLIVSPLPGLLEMNI